MAFEPNQIPDFLLASLAYRDGHLFWKDGSLKTRSGKKAGCMSKDGYVIVAHKKTQYPAHRITYALFYGDTDMEIDHINRIRTDNRIENLRKVSRQQNANNMHLKSLKAKSGVRGVDFYMGAWRVMHRCKYVGSYETLLDAVCAKIGAVRETFLELGIAEQDSI